MFGGENNQGTQCQAIQGIYQSARRVGVPEKYAI